MGRIEKLRLTSLVLNIIFIPAFLFVLWLYLTKPCPPCQEPGTTVIKTEVIPVKDSSLKKVSVKVPVPYAVKPKYILKKGKLKPVVNSLPAVPQVNTVEECDSAGTVAPSPCDSVYFYSDTTKADSVTIVANDTVMNNKIIGRSIWVVNLKPNTKITETTVKPERWKFYIGGSFTIYQREITRWGAGPSMLLTIPKIGGFSYTFDAKNFGHMGTFYALIRLKK